MYVSLSTYRDFGNPEIKPALSRLWYLSPWFYCTIIDVGAAAYGQARPARRQAVQRTPATRQTQLIFIHMSTRYVPAAEINSFSQKEE